MFDPHSIDPSLLQKMEYDALVWSSLHGLLVGDRASQKSGRVPGVGLIHAPISLLPMPFPESHWKQACEVAPIFNELVDRVSLDAEFLHESLSRTKKVDAFTSRLLDIHAKMIDMNKKEEIRLGLHRSDYMLDEQTNLLLQIELNTNSSSFPGLSCLVSDLHRLSNMRRNEFKSSISRTPLHILQQDACEECWDLLTILTCSAVFACKVSHATPSVCLIKLYLDNACLSVTPLKCEFGTLLLLFIVQTEGLDAVRQMMRKSLLHQFKQHLALDPERIPQNNSVSLFAEALYKAWAEYNNPRAIVMVVVQTEERNIIRKTLAEIDAQGELLPDGTLVVDGEAVAVVYFRAGYAPTDYPSESEWSARLLIEQSCAIKCPSIAYHLAGTKKIQQELAKPNQLERFLENKDDIAKVRECFAGLWSLDDLSIVKDAIERPGLYVMKPQREGGGNNIYDDDVRLSLQRMEKAGSEENAAYILMQRIFPIISPAILMREGISHKERVMSELGVYGTYLRNKTGVIMNGHAGYLMRTKVSSSNEGGVAAGFAVLDSIYLV
ncbi:hypothetical protein DH2020_028245 [Rehmannia glutinosa]|uniref:Glutathione synthetase n=1 Tax=Rehmannia glutinosa TaxID=99300 RepID=A0ABR0VTQ3_REHGL